MLFFTLQTSFELNNFTYSYCREFEILLERKDSYQGGKKKKLMGVSEAVK